jgi:hypothetical protein
VAGSVDQDVWVDGYGCHLDPFLRVLVVLDSRHRGWMCSPKKKMNLGICPFSYIISVHCSASHLQGGIVVYPTFFPGGARLRACPFVRGLVGWSPQEFRPEMQVAHFYLWCGVVLACVCVRVTVSILAQTTRVTFRRNEVEW